MIVTLTDAVTMTITGTRKGTSTGIETRMKPWAGRNLEAGISRLEVGSKKLEAGADYRRQEAAGRIQQLRDKRCEM